MAQIIPIVNINGTSKTELIQGRCDAASAVRAALAAIAQQSPHPRDWQTDESLGGYQEARSIHYNRLRLLNQLHDDLEAEAIAIDEQN